MCFLFYAQGFNDVMQPQDLKFDFLFNENSFDVNEKHFS